LKHQKNHKSLENARKNEKRNTSFFHCTFVAVDSDGFYLLIVDLHELIRLAALARKKLKPRLASE